MMKAILAMLMVLAGGVASNTNPSDVPISVSVQATQFAQGSDSTGAWYIALLQVNTTQGQCRISGHITLTSRSPIVNMARGTSVPVTITLPGAIAADKTSMPWNVRQISKVGSDYWMELHFFVPGKMEGIITLMSPMPFGLIVGDAVPVSFVPPDLAVATTR